MQSSLIFNYTHGGQGGGGGDNSNKCCFGTKPKLFQESGDFSRNRDTYNFFRETRYNSGVLQKKIGTSKEMYPKNSGG